MVNVSGKVVVITGAGSGLGAETARHLVRAGARVVLGARRLDQLQVLADELGIDQDAIRETDVVNPDQVRALVDHAVALHGRIDVMINNAGIMPTGLLEHLRINEWDRIIDLNVKGVLYGIAAALPHMKAQKSGHIMNVSSIAGHVVNPAVVVYCATKYAVRAISEGLRKEVRPYNIRSTILSPGAILGGGPMEEGADPTRHDTLTAYYRRIAIPASSFARSVLFAISQPEDVDIDETLFDLAPQNV
ncbi:SDR family oxidoreductase [Brevundimonas sp.]|jgi:NADP-dependent 3-hydroxy acid dehydrogenase YdfG|uniref:SDR family oxidoreductase n=1 Tax=Brevundimonas sp. TaxID=1871086 RepID=UPI0037BE6CE9